MSLRVREAILFYYDLIRLLRQKRWTPKAGPGPGTPYGGYPPGFGAMTLNREGN